MKKYILVITFMGLFSCGNKAENKTNLSLQEQKSKIEKQIDSLSKLLVGIDKELEKDKKEEVPIIEVQKISQKPFVHYIELQGNIDTDGNVMVIPEAMGSVKKIYKKEGDKVKKGEIIMRLDNSVLSNQISELQTQYSLAKTSFERQKRLWDQKIGSEMNYLQAETKMKSLSKKLKTLRSQLAKFNVKAPISGVLDDLMIKEGEMGAPQRPVARIVNLNKVYMQADVSEKYLSVIKKGSMVIIDFPELNKKIESNISYVGSFIHPNNRTYKIRINLLNFDGDLKPNLTGNIRIKDFETSSGIVLPMSLVQEDRKGNNYVFVVKKEKTDTDIYHIEKQIITLGAEYQGKVLVKSGLQTNDLLAQQAARGLTEGEKVKLAKKVLEKNTKKNTEKSVTKNDNNFTYHIVEKGETLYRIHKKYHVSLQELKEWNQLKDNSVKEGEKLIVKK